MWFRWMTRQNYLLHNPASEIELPRLPKPLPRVSDRIRGRDDPASAQRRRPARHPRPRHAGDVLLDRNAAHRTAPLRLYDVDREAGIVTIREGKGKKDRVIPIGERAVAWLDKYLDQARPRLVAEPDDGTLFLTAQGEPFVPTVSAAWSGDYVEAAGIGKHGACHLFRHTMATLMLEGGADIRFIQQMLGHARLDTTQIYTHVSIRMLKQIHSATHPAAQLKRGSEDPEEAVEKRRACPGCSGPDVARCSGLDSRGIVRRSGRRIR